VLYSPVRYVLLAVSALALLPLGWLAGGGGERGIGGLPRIVALELAGSEERAGEILSRWAHDGLLPAARTAVLWDFGFVAVYVLFGILLAAAVARPLSKPWDTIGLGTGAAVLVAGLCDLAENIGLLAQLEGTLGAAGATTAFARIKFILLAVGALALLVLLAVRVTGIGARSAPPPLLWGSRRSTRPDADLLNCDLVMKGGITSGVVYPGAVYALARRYRFRSIGGSSAGAIAAAVTAAAEYRRRATGSFEGFEELRRVTESLAREDRLYTLFQPAPACAGLFDVLASALREGTPLGRVCWASLAAIAAFPLAPPLALSPGVVGMIVAANASLSATGVALVVAAGLALAALLLPLLLTALAGWTATRALPRHGYGLCPGPTQDAQRGAALSDWLAEQIDRVAFGDRWASDGPLTLGHLWCGGIPTPEKLKERQSSQVPREVNLEVLTTSLTYGRPYRIPFEGIGLWFRKHDLLSVLPERVVEAMAKHATQPSSRSHLPPPPEGVLGLPANESLPVVFLARMSLSFPALLAAPKLVGVRIKPIAVDAGDVVPDEEEQTVPAKVPQFRAQYEDMWFSDGGISSNFPIHFFDSPIPNWPTFGLDLGEAPEGTDKDKRIFIPHKNLDGMWATWQTIGGVGQFVGSLGTSLHAWMDNMQKRAPGYRDRVARLLLTPQEGGLNLRMPAERIVFIANLGYGVGDQLGSWFDPEVEQVISPPGELPVRTFRPWDNQRWIRFRSTVALLETMAEAFQKAFRRPPPAGARSYQDMLSQIDGPPPSYPYPPSVLKAASTFTDAILALPVSPGDSLSERSPRPRPVLRIVPKV